MVNPLTRLAVGAVHHIGARQSKSYQVQRSSFDPTQVDEVSRYGLNLIHDIFTIPSSGLHHVSGAQIQQFALYLRQHANDRAFYTDNSRSEYLYRQGHVYLYCSPLLPITAQAVSYITQNTNNAMRLCVRAFTRGAIELPEGTISQMRQQTRNKHKSRHLFQGLRSDPAVLAYQRAQWEAQKPVLGDVMLGHNSIILNTRQERYLLEDGRCIVDFINPATREFHILDGSSLWIRIVDTSAHTLLFAVIGTGKHRYVLMDAFNNIGALGIWHYMALVQQHLYADVPAPHDQITAYLERVRDRSDPVAHRLYRTLSRMDNNLMGSFGRNIRRGHAYEAGDTYQPLS